ncbi:aspartate carbamoyltransferase [Candidatus Gottesmanbacteria bacterium]|nr:aspartate carbamoyltransferase [Candidatus Gottesmanbacteria bacterium]
MDSSLFKKDILTASQFTKKDVERVVAVTRSMRDIVDKDGSTDILKGNIMTALFYEPSSRTFGSFVAAMQRLGGGFIPLQGVVYSSVAKGESLPDTVRTFASFSDCIVLRHPQVGAAVTAADATAKPVINAGDGPGEHPTQALLDFFTIMDHFGSVDGLTITLVGDLLNGRTVHSLITLLSLFSPKAIHLVSPEVLKMTRDHLEGPKKSGIKVIEHEALDDVLGETDVLYATRVQKERFTDLDVYEKVKYSYIITPDIMKKSKKTAILMHPFPRLGEIDGAVDADPRALYLRAQIPNGMYVRMALLALVLKEDISV